LKLQNERLEMRLNQSNIRMAPDPTMESPSTPMQQFDVNQIPKSLGDLKLNFTKVGNEGAMPLDTPNTTVSKRFGDIKFTNLAEFSAFGTEDGIPLESQAHHRHEEHINPSNSLIVVFNLTTKPATVMSATDNFCKIMGYGMHELTGMPWWRFLHPNYIERTMHIFNHIASNSNTTIQFYQVYKTKDGHVFNTLDTHKFFYGADGKPVSDIVSISLQQQNLNITPQLSLTEKEDVSVESPQPDSPNFPSITSMSDSSEVSRDGTSLSPSPFIYSLGSMDDLSSFHHNDSSFTLGPDSIPSSPHIEGMTDEDIFKLLLTPPQNLT